MNQLTVLDAHVLETLRMLTGEGEPDVLAEVLCLFRDDAPSRVAAIRSACQAGDTQAVSRAAHSLKGAAGNIGATALHAVCRDIETAAQAGDLVAVGALIGALEREAAHVERDIAEVLRG